MAKGSDMYDVFGPAEESRIENAIAQAELQTSGEIRVHIDNKCKENVLDRAAFLFEELEMHQTELRNGVLIYLAIQDKKLAIIGDAGINSKVQKDFWNEIKTQMIHDCREERFVDAIVNAVLSAGKQLTSHFPYQKDDQNELPNQISFGKA
jgi:uncharacterized membrane protein